jgi:hypothetical protein
MPNHLTSVCRGVRDSSQIEGILLLRFFQPDFFIHWSQIESSYPQSYSRLINLKSFPLSSSFGLNSPFTLNVKNIDYISFDENPFKINFHHLSQCRTFFIDTKYFKSIVHFIESLIKNGISVPSIKSKYSLEFYSDFSYKIFLLTPPHIILNVQEFSDLESLFVQVRELSKNILLYLDKASIIPKHNTFPLSSAAQSHHDQVLRSIKSTFEKLSINQITEEDYPHLFNDNGQLIDPDLFFKRIFFKGLPSSLLQSALPFILGIYPPLSTTEERKDIIQRKKDLFQNLLNQMNSYSEEQINATKRLYSAFRVIVQDVLRTDRQHPAFSNQTGIGLKILTDLLRCYCIFNPQISYLQGMNDLFVPIILAFFPEWDENSNPITTLSVEDELPLIFWCYKSLLQQTNHLKLLGDVTKLCQRYSALILDILTRISPLFSIWLKQHGFSEFLWIYSDFVLLYKRTLGERIWPVWFQLTCSIEPSEWLIYFSASVMLLSFDVFAGNNEISMSNITDIFSEVFRNLDFEEVGHLSEYLYHHFKVTPKQKSMKRKELYNFELFEEPK